MRTLLKKEDQLLHELGQFISIVKLQLQSSMKKQLMYNKFIQINYLAET